MTFQDYYAILGVAPSADSHAIQRAFRKKAIESHPDRGGSHQAMVLVNEAWYVLRDSRQREAYDRERSRRSSSSNSEEVHNAAHRAREEAQRYPNSADDLDQWFDRVTRDFTSAQYGRTEGNFHTPPFPSSAGSRSAMSFIVIGGILGVLVGLFIFYVSLNPSSSRPRVGYLAFKVLVLFAAGGAWLGRLAHQVVAQAIIGPSLAERKQSLTRKIRSFFSNEMRFGDAFSACTGNFKTALHKMMPQFASCLILAAPFAVICSLLALLVLDGSAAAGVVDADPGTTGVAVARSAMLRQRLFVLVITPLSAYFGFCSIRFVSRASANPAQSFSFGALYAYDSTLWGFTGVGFILLFIGGLGSGAAALVSMVLFFLFGLPAYLFLFFWVAFCACSAFSFFESPGSGVVAAIARGWSLVTRDWKRWLVMLLLMGGAFIAYLAFNLALSSTIGVVPVLGRIAMNISTIMVGFYFIFVFYGAYRDSSA